MKNTLIYAIVPAAILGVAIVIATIVYCERTRYEYHQWGESGRNTRVFDKTTGDFKTKTR